MGFISFDLFEFLRVESAQIAGETVKFILFLCEFSPTIIISEAYLNGHIL